MARVSKVVKLNRFARLEIERASSLNAPTSNLPPLRSSAMRSDPAAMRMHSSLPQRAQSRP
eukprot:4689105-Pyramimonas_sp.AAC.1